jgi:L-ascorbate metabolism protein UlaG (beta-lactamase superfamily)
MRVIKFTHSCVRLEKDDRALVIDPGSFSEDEPLDQAGAVLITHEHPDHLDAEKLRKRPDLQIWTNQAVADKLRAADVGSDRVHIAADGDEFTVEGFAISAHGEWHEVVHPDLPRVPNIGFLVDRNFFHPGDAFTVLDRPVDTVMVPVSAPWLRGADSVEYIRAMRPAIASSASRLARSEAFSCSLVATRPLAQARSP